jgi:putative peptidoglycan lipid II flippase
LSEATTDDQVEGGNTSLLRSSGLVAMGTALSRLTGFARLGAAAYAIGFKSLNDTYTLANNTPNIVYELLLGGVLSATLVPIFVHHSEADDDEGTSAVITVAAAALIALTVAGILAAPLIMRLYTITAHGSVAAEQRQVATSMLRLLMPQMFFYGLTAMATALLNARRKFAAPAFAPVLNNLVVIAVLLALPHVAGHTPTLRDVRDDATLLWLLGLGTTAGIVAMTVVLWPAVQRSGFRFRPNFDWRNPAVREVGRMSGWTLGYVLNNQAALLLVLLLANRTVGGVSTYVAAQVFFILPHALVAVSLMTTIVPGLSSAANRSDHDSYRRQFSNGVRLMSLVILPAAVGYVVLAQPIAHGLLKHGATAGSSAHLIGSNLALFSVGLLGYSIYLYTLRGFYALRDTRTPFFLNLAENGINVVLAFILEPIWGVPGLALSYAIAYNAAGIFAFLALRRRVGRLDGRRTARTVARVLVACALMATAVAAVIRVVGDTALVQTTAGVLVGGVVFVVAVLALRVEEVDAVRARVLAVVRR